MDELKYGFVEVDETFFLLKKKEKKNFLKEDS